MKRGVLWAFKPDVNICVLANGCFTAAARTYRREIEEFAIFLLNCPGLGQYSQRCLQADLRAGFLETLTLFVITQLRTRNRFPLPLELLSLAKAIGKPSS